MFGRRFFGGRYFAPRYFGDGGEAGPAAAKPITATVTLSAGTAAVEQSVGVATITIRSSG